MSNDIRFLCQLFSPAGSRMPPIRVASRPPDTAQTNTREGTTTTTITTTTTQPTKTTTPTSASTTTVTSAACSVVVPAVVSDCVPSDPAPTVNSLTPAPLPLPSPGMIDDTLLINQEFLVWSEMLMAFVVGRQSRSASHPVGPLEPGALRVLQSIESIENELLSNLRELVTGLHRLMRTVNRVAYEVYPSVVRLEEQRAAAGVQSAVRLSAPSSHASTSMAATVAHASESPPPIARSLSSGPTTMMAIDRLVSLMQSHSEGSRSESASPPGVASIPLPGTLVASPSAPLSSSSSSLQPLQPLSSSSSSSRRSLRSSSGTKRKREDKDDDTDADQGGKK